ncbi:HXXEE domain-containing protein [Vagococcus entomophilus]|nr:HXXEE domain-containing protein [Vagococcus entomophilus]
MWLNFLWLPILFIIHDFEEIIFVPMWIKKHTKVLEKKNRPLFGGITNSAVFSVGVVEEFILLVVISLYGMIHPGGALYFGAGIAYVIHLFLHLIFCIQYHSYVPGVVTAFLQIPVMVYLLHEVYASLDCSLPHIVLISCICCVLILGNVLCLHQFMHQLTKKAFL